MLSHFDLLAPIYDMFMKPPDPLTWRDLLELPAGRMLDAGGGTGRISAPLKSYVDQLVIVDLSDRMMKKAAKKGIANTVRADVSRLPFPGEIFDRIVVVDSFHHFALQEETIRDLSRILKPGGLMVIEEFDIRRAAVKGLALIEKILWMKSRFLPAEEIGEMAVQSGLSAEIRAGEDFEVRIIARKSTSSSWRSQQPTRSGPVRYPRE